MTGTVVYTTVFPNAMPFLADFDRSLSAQTDDDFDLCVGLDRLAAADVAPRMSRTVCRWFEPRPDDTPARLRARALMSLSQDYQRIVLVDSDDVLMPERVAAAVAALQDVDVYGCALRLVDRDGRRLPGSITAPPEQDWLEFLALGNVFGLSNTAYASTLVRDLGGVADSTGIVDWYLVSLAAARGARIHFDASEHMLYRQYGASTLESHPPYTGPGVLRATELALAHYAAIEPAVRGLHPGFADALRDRTATVEEFRRYVEGSSNLTAYLKAANASAVLPGQVTWWWWQVARPELESMWRRGS